MKKQKNITTNLGCCGNWQAVAMQLSSSWFLGGLLVCLCDILVSPSVQGFFFSPVLIVGEMTILSTNGNMSTLKMCYKGLDEIVSHPLLKKEWKILT